MRTPPPFLITILTASIGAVRTAIHYVRHGALNVTPDSANYLYAALSIQGGRGYLDTDDAPLTLFPPGFSLAIVGMDLIAPGGEMAAALLVNLIGLFALALAVGVVAQRAGAGWWGPAVVAWFGLSAPVQLIATAAWSEPLALALCGWTFVGIQQYIARPHARWLLVLVGLGAGAAVLVRTSSAFWVLGLVAACWINSRYRAGLLVGLLGAAPASLWALINYATHGDAAGVRGAPSSDALSITSHAIRTATNWWSLPRPGPWRLIGLVALAALVIVVARSRLVPAARAAIVLLGVVATGTLAISILVAMNPLGNRLLAPVLLGIALVIATTIGSWRTTRLDRALVGMVALGAALGSVHGLMVSGPREVLPPDMRCEFPPADLLLSNAAEVVAYRCARPVAASPRKYLYASTQATDQLAKLAAQQASRCVRVIWIGGNSSSSRDLESIGFTTVKQRSWHLLSSQGCRSGDEQSQVTSGGGSGERDALAETGTALHGSRLRRWTG